ncbi:DUF4752 family protein [Lonsdalea quercina]|uniref:DUF4752 family protein n=1 Tax=Lonsdalea quercina TaxID=71657 RepID=UPI0039756569
MMSEFSDCLNIGLAIFGYLFIMYKAWQWLFHLAFHAYDKAQKKSRIEKAVDDLYDALELDKINYSQTVKVTAKGGVVFMMYRSGY